MQTLRKRTSPCKYKNDPSRFLGEGITFKAKLIGILEVNEARGDKMCQDALNDLKTAIRAAGEHKQRITISISIEGLKLRDEKSGDCLYHHPVHKISFIAQDMSDSRAFGYIFGSPDTGHRFFGIKTDKTASQVVISMRDLFQVVFELKKKEIEIAKHNSEQQQQQIKYGSSSYMDSLHFTKDESDADKGKNKYSQLLKSRCLVSKPGEPSTSDYKGATSEAIADLLDLEHELNNIQQGITQMEKMTPSDPFGPLAKPPDSYVDPFDDSFPPHHDRPPSDLSSIRPATHSSSHPPSSTDDRNDTDVAGPPSIFGSTVSSSKASFFSQFSPALTTAKADDARWFDQETESLFNESVGANNAEPISSPVVLNAPATDPEQVEGKKSPVKTDLFTELDPLGTGRVKPYVDKKDFFQELKNPPKKVLKELITESTVTESPASFCFSPGLKEEKTTKSDSAHSSSTIDSAQGFTPRYAKMDPFEDSDPFDKTDPFQEEAFPTLFSNKPSVDSIFDEKPPWKFDLKDDFGKTVDFPLFTSPALRVSLPPEKPNPSTFTNFKTPPDSPENTKSLRRKNYHVLKQTTIEGSEESPVQEEPFVSCKVTNSTKSETVKYYSPPSSRTEKPRMYSSEMSEVTTPDPPPRAKTSLFFIKPPPLPPKKTAQTKPPARPPSLEDNAFQYDYLEKKEPPRKEELKCVKLKKPPFGARNSPPIDRKQSSESAFPVLPPPPNRKSDSGKLVCGRRTDKSEGPGSILNLKLNQLDNTGLENLAVTLGLPSESIYCMTLQELTKMLAEKYLISDVKAEQPSGDSFEVDFDANFAKMEANPPPSIPSYDKYAVFKELIENENKAPAQRNAEAQEEDKYAALRQLSLTVDKGEDGSEEEDGREKAVSASPAPEELSSAINNLDLVASIVGAKWSPPEGKGTEEHAEKEKSSDQEGNDGSLFPLENQIAKEQKAGKENWATFEKSDFLEAKTLKVFNEAETSPLSSDGKEDVAEMGFHWEQTAFRKRTRKDVPWRDDDESWDDYSPKESFCSDESSHEERSPDPRKGEKRYEKAVWEVCGREAQGGNKWAQREKWAEETEDEFEENWRKQKERTNSYEFDRKTGFWHNSCETYGKWYNSRSEPWDENDRHVHCYMSMRKRSESDNEYRKRCDSDASEKECAWTFQKNYPDTLGRSSKQKQYYGFRDCSEHCHESRTKHRKSVLQKRPSSASDPKRAYEKISSPADYAFRGSEKDDYFRYQCARKDFRHRDPDFSHHHSDKRPSQQHAKTTCRTSRSSGSAQADLYPSPNKRTGPPETKNHQFDYFEPFRESVHKQRNIHLESEGEAFEKSRTSALEPTDRSNQWASANGKAHDGFFSTRPGDNFAKFSEESKPSPKKGWENGRADGASGAEIGRPEGKAKGHLGPLYRQESAATLRKSDSINIFSRDKDPFEGDDFFSSVS